MKRLWIILIFIQIIFTSHFIYSQSSINFKILQPRPNQLSGDSLFVSVQITSTYEIVSVTAEVENHTAVLAPAKGYIQGYLNLAGLQRGAKTLTITAKDFNGFTASDSINFIYDKKPVLSVALPQQNYILAQPYINVQANASDDDTTFGAKIYAMVNSEVIIASARNSMDTTLDLSAYDGEKIILSIEAIDSENQTVIQYYSVYVESNNRLQLIKNYDDIIDAFNDSLAVLGQGTYFSIINRYTNYITKVNFPTLFYYDRENYLDNDIFVVTARNSATALWAMYYYKNDSLILISNNSYFNPSSLSGKGNYIIWNEGKNLFLTNLTLGNKILISSIAGNNYNDVTGEGEVAFWSYLNSSYCINFYKNGITTIIDSSGMNVYPVTDGNSIVYRKTINGVSSIILYNNSTYTVLSNNVGDVSPVFDYAINNGWIAFVTLGNLNQTQIVLRSPQGIEKQITHWGTFSDIISLSRNGQVVLSNSSKLYYADFNNPTPIGIADYSSGLAVWIGDSLYYAIGPGLFKVDLNVSGIKNNNLSIYNFYLAQNYPNPFNPSTAISYQLSAGSNVTLKVYDVLGRLVKTLVNKFQYQGKYNVSFNASNLPSGVYFYQLKAGSNTSTNKMLLLK